MLGRIQILPVKWWTSLILVLALLMAASGPRFYLLLRQMMFWSTREVARKTAYLTSINLKSKETEHFVIKYGKGEEAIAQLVAETAEEAYRSVVDIMKEAPRQKTLVIIYPDAESLALSFGWQGDANTMGVYFKGVIRILDPRLWIEGDVREAFFREGPMVHELVHLMIDYMTQGNYPRWFTEGVAQYVEKKVTGFELAGPFGDEKAVYDFAYLDKNFDRIDQATAYWQSLMAVEEMVKLYGEDNLFQMLSFLAKGYDFSAAFQSTTKTSFSQFEEDFLGAFRKSF